MSKRLDPEVKQLRKKVRELEYILSNVYRWHDKSRGALERIANLKHVCGDDGCGMFVAEEIACEALGIGPLSDGPTNVVWADGSGRKRAYDYTS
jgi:hypothetical protein